MADIFISYSRRDSEQALSLAENLRANGMTVWIDQLGIEAATSWSKEIANALEQCKTVLLLVSSGSVGSENVAKELSVAARLKKRIIPVQLERVELKGEFLYHLTHLQRVPVADFDSIIRAINKTSVESASIETTNHTTSFPNDDRKSLMILPFEDISPTADNQWFADGIVSEMISSLSNVKALKVTDAQTTKEFKKYKGQLTIYAKEMGIRYFVEGDVRKFGDSIKITSRLLDIETGEHLWQDSLKGTMGDIFDIQETVAKKVVEGLQVIITTEEKEKVEKRLTQNTEAYELYLKAAEYFYRHTKADFERAIELYEEVVRLDPACTKAHLGISSVSMAYYKVYSHTAESLQRVTKHLQLAVELEGESAGTYYIRSLLALWEGNTDEALSYGIKATEIDPKSSKGYEALGRVYQALRRFEDAVEVRKKYCDLEEYKIASHFNYFVSILDLNDPVRIREEAIKLLPLFERHVRLSPDDFHVVATLAIIYSKAGRREQSLTIASNLEHNPAMDGLGLYNLACLLLDEDDPTGGMRLLRKAVDKGYSNTQYLIGNPVFNPLRGTPEFEALIKELEEKITTEN